MKPPEVVRLSQEQLNRLALLRRRESQIKVEKARAFGISDEVINECIRADKADAVERFELGTSTYSINGGSYALVDVDEESFTFRLTTSPWAP